MPGKKFWVVWNPNGRNPAYRHDSYESARKEAERLAKQCDDQEFYVLAAIGKAQRVTVQYDEYYDNGIPF